jgi:hypothetical protein
MSGHRVALGEFLGDLPRQTAAEALGFVDLNELLKLAIGICLDAGLFCLEQASVSLVLGPLLAIAGTGGSKTAG